MKRYWDSLSATVVTIAIAVSIVAGGFVASSGQHWGLMALTLLVGVVGCIVGLVLGVNKHPGVVISLLIALPLILWPYVMGLIYVVKSRPDLGPVLIVLGLGIGASRSVAAAFRTRLRAMPALKRISQ